MENGIHYWLRALIYGGEWHLSMIESMKKSECEIMNLILTLIHFSSTLLSEQTTNLRNTRAASQLYALNVIWHGARSGMVQEASFERGPRILWKLFGKDKFWSLEAFIVRFCHGSSGWCRSDCDEDAEFANTMASIYVVCEETCAKPTTPPPSIFSTSNSQFPTDQSDVRPRDCKDIMRRFLCGVVHYFMRAASRWWICALNEYLKRAKKPRAMQLVGRTTSWHVDIET